MPGLVPGDTLRDRTEIGSGTGKVGGGGGGGGGGGASSCASTGTGGKFLLPRRHHELHLELPSERRISKNLALPP